MHEAVKEGYGGGGGLRRALSFYGRLGIDFWGALLDLQRGELSFGVGLDQYRHRFAGGFGHGGQDIHMISWS
jgi:hypothetical protein